MESEYENLLKEEQAELANSVEYDAAFEALKAKNEESLKELSQLENDLSSAISEYETIYRFKGSCAEQCFIVKAKTYQINGEMQKNKQLVNDIDQSIFFWKNIRAEDDENGKSCDAHLADLLKSDWVVQNIQAKEEVENYRNLLAEKQQTLAELENAKKYKSPKTGVDNKTIEMFRNMVRSELRLNSNRVTEAPPPRLERPGRASLESTPTRKQKEVESHVPSPRTQHVEVEATAPEDESDLTVTRIEFNDDNSSERDKQSQEQPMEQDVEVEEEEPEEEEQNLFSNLSSDAIQVNVTDEQHSPRIERTPSPKATPPNARPKPPQNFTPRNDDHLFKVPAIPPRHSPPKSNNNRTTDDDINFLNFDTEPGMDLNSQEGGSADFYNLLGDNNQSRDNNDAPVFSFLTDAAEQTNNSGSNGNFFSFGSPQGKKDESSHGFFF